MKPFPFYLSWLPFYQPVFPDEPWFSHSIVTIWLADHMPSLGCFTHSWGTVVMSGLVSQLLNLYFFWVVPPLPEPVATLYTTRSSRRSQLSALFWLSKYEKIAEALVVSILLKWLRNDIYPVYVYPFSGWDRLFTKKEYPSLSRLGGFLRHSFLPFLIWGTIYEKGPLEFTFQLSFQTL